MRNLSATLAHVERQFEAAVEAPKPRPMAPARTAAPSSMVEPAALQTARLRQAKPKPLVTVHVPSKALPLTARALKLSCVIDPVPLMGPLPPGERMAFALSVAEAGGRRLSGTLNRKTVGKVLRVLAEHGLDQVAVILQGKLAAGDVLAEAGLVAQVKGGHPDDRHPPGRG